MSILLQNISKKYGSQQVLQDLNLSVSSGEIVGFLGLNGAGKSTTMRIITGYLQPNKGSVNICGIDALASSIEARRQIGYLPENNPLYLDMYVKEYLLFVAGIYRLGNRAKARVDEILEQTGLIKEFRKKIGQLSKGYRQRVGLAQALLHDPQVLILDEPTSGLDPSQLAEVRELIKNIGKQKTVMLSTHIMQEVTAVCQRVVIINKGNIIADRSSAEILTEGLASSGKFLTVAEFNKDIKQSDLMRIDGVSAAVEIKPMCWQLESESDIRPDVFRFSVENNLILMTLHLQEKVMEDVFRELTH
jgi:ABC-2 type transport system ATP-binding protein